MISLFLALCILCRPYWQSDVALLRTMPYEYAVVYSADYSVRIETTARDCCKVYFYHYDDTIRNGGHVVHNHPRIGCPSFSYGDIKLAMLLNLADTAVVASDGRSYHAIRAIGGWKFLGEPQFEAAFYPNQRKYGTCKGLALTWRQIAGKYGFIYVERRL